VQSYDCEASAASYFHVCRAPDACRVVPMNASACNGSRTAPLSRIECAAGYHGPLCSLCQAPGYGPFGTACVECWPLAFSAATTVGVCILYSVLIAFVVSRKAAGSGKRRARHSAYLRFLLNFMSGELKLCCVASLAYVPLSLKTAPIFAVAPSQWALR
jgi:hypothetical protein